MTNNSSNWLVYNTVVVRAFCVYVLGWGLRFLISSSYSKDAVNIFFHTYFDKKNSYQCTISTHRIGAQVPLAVQPRLGFYPPSEQLTSYNCIMHSLSLSL